MSTTAANSVTYRKIDPSKLSFFDLPAEVREKIYLHYFPHPRDIYIHLFYDTAQSDDKGDRTKEKARFSTECQTWLEATPNSKAGWHPSNENKDEGVNVAADPLQRRYKSVADMLADAPASSLVWTSPEAAARALYKEASTYSYRYQQFKVRGKSGDFLPQFHKKLSVVPKRLLSKIQRLQISPYNNDSERYQSLKVMDKLWSSETWIFVLTQMSSLRELQIRNLSSPSIYYYLRSFTTAKAWFMGSKPNVCFELAVYGPRIERPRSYPPYPKSLPDTVAPRVIMPPLQKLSLHGYAFFHQGIPQFWNALTNPANRPRWNGDTFKHTKTTPQRADFWQAERRT